ncbi:MAG: amidohydrolase [Bacillota bacterium]|nr:amidohydrolase [Bacillota bacterium]
MDLIFYNGRVTTLDDSRPFAEAVGVKNGLIAFVGTNRKLSSYKTGKTLAIDLKGKTMLPGFNDSHLHLAGYALTSAKVDLRDCRNIDQVVDTVKSYIVFHSIKPGDWVLGWGWDHGLFEERRMPDRRDLDRATSEHCLVIMRTCCHICSINTRALMKAGIFESQPYVEGGSIVQDDQGIPTGILKENAMNLVMDLVPGLNKEMLKKLIFKAVQDFVSAGLTSVQTDDLAALGSDMLPTLLDSYRELELEGNLPLRINLQLLLPEITDLDKFIKEGYRNYYNSDFFKTGPLKILADGSIGGRTAFLSEPYYDTGDSCGVAIYQEDELTELVKMAYLNGMQVATHAIGDAAINMVLDTYEQVLSINSHHDPRFRIVHASIVDDHALYRFKTLGIIADIQPSFIPTDNSLIDQHLGPRRASWTYRWKDFISNGIRVGGGSDAPVETYEPLAGISAAVTRQNKSGKPTGGWHPDQRLTLHEALNLYTSGSAFCSFDENMKGTITPGKFADLLVLSEDIAKVEPKNIRDVKCEMTVVDGKIVYENQGSG